MTDSRMKREALPREPDQSAEFHVGVIDGQREPNTVFHRRIGLRLWLDFEQALELQRCLVEAMQTKFVGEELLSIELEPGLLEIYEPGKPLDDDPPRCSDCGQLCEAAWVCPNLNLDHDDDEGLPCEPDEKSN